ncbi:unnamed protein product [Peronospora farinosa]|uniref:Uncharacterized protein n=1 Tax=Peronospora farinosa TaxID=134698 RepID=A0ABN8BYB0_9STRA|nr:unnamed protein product [Peronospora farinosa]
MEFSNLLRLIVSQKSGFSLAHLGISIGSPKQGISFVCTSDDALRRLGRVQILICDTVFTIRKYSSYHTLYSVDLQRLPADVPDLAIYDWFIARGARLILITPTQVLGELKSRARTVYFNSVACPGPLFEPNDEPLRELFFFEGERSCYVQHRLRRYNRVKPPSLRPPPRPAIKVSDTYMYIDAGDVSPVAVPTTASSSHDTSLTPPIRT